MARTKQPTKKNLRRKSSAAGAGPSNSTAQQTPRSSPRSAARPPKSADGTRKKRRNRPGTVALREIRKYQKSWDLLIPTAPFVRLVKEISNHEAPDITRWQAEALVGLQEAAEEYIVQLFGEALLCAVHAKRVTLMSKDFELARELEVKGGLIERALPPHREFTLDIGILFGKIKFLVNCKYLLNVGMN